MKIKKLLKSTLCLLMALVCNVAWAESVMPKISDAPAEGQWAANTTWYQIKTGNGYYFRSDVTDNDGLKLTDTNSTLNDESLWCIVGNAENGYAFYNKAKGATMLLGMTGENQNARASFVALGNTDKTTAFDFTASAKNEHWCVKEHKSANNYWNKRDNYLAYWNSSQAVWGWGGTQDNPAGGDNGSALLFMEVVPLTYLLTDAVGNTFEGEYEGIAGTTEPSFAGVVGYTFINKVWNGTHFTATINFPFPVSKAGQENWTFIKSYPMNQRDCYFHVDDAYTKVITRSTIADNGMTYLPTIDKIAKWQWAIYPAFADGKFTFTIKNRAANKFVGGTSSTSTVDPTPLVAEGAGVFCWGACIGDGKGFYLADNTNMFFAANSSSKGDQNTILWPKPQSGSNHQGANLRFPEASYTVTTDGNGYAAIYTPMAVTIPSGVTAYVGRLNADNSVLFLEAVSTAIPANTAVILKGAASTTYVLAKSSDAVAAIDGNVLQGAETSVEVSAIEGFAYTYQASNTTFAKVTEGVVPAYSAYVVSQGGTDDISIDDTKAEAISHVVANASKLGQDFGRAYYVANGAKLCTADDALAAIYAAADADAANEIVGSFKYNIPAAGTAYYLKDNHGTYLDLHHLGSWSGAAGSENTLATMSATKQLLYITGNEEDGTWKIHTTAEGGNYLHQSSTIGWNSKVSSDGGNFKWEVEGVDVSGTPHYMLKNISGQHNGYLGADSHTAGNALYVNQNDAAKKLKMQLLPVKSITLSAVTTAEWLNEESVAVPSGKVPDAVDEKYKEKVVSSGEYFYISAGRLKGVFQHRSNSGTNRTDIVAVEVIDLEGKVVASDYHWGYAGNNSENNIYTMYIPQDGLYYIRYYAEYVENGGEHNSDVDITYALLPANGYYHMSSKDTSRKEHLYNDATHTGNGGRITLQSDTKVTTNNGIWHITYLGDNKIGIKNGDGNPIKADKGATAGAYSELTIGATTTADGIDYYYFDVALNCSKSGYTINGIDHLTTWVDGGSGKDDNLWRLEPVSVEGKTIYEVVVDHADAYVAYNNGTTVQNAFNGGFFITDGATITAEQLSAAILENEFRTEPTITIEGTTITLSGVKPLIVKQDLYNTSKIDPNNLTPPYRIPGITVDPETGRIITAAAELVCGTDPGFGEVDIVCRYSDYNGETWSDMIKVANGTGEESAERNIFETAFGDPAIVADRTSEEVLVVAVAGCTKYLHDNTTRQNPNMIATIHSNDNGETWGTPVDVTEDIYSLFDSGNPMQAAFVGGGKLFQSRIVKVGQYYRLYAAMCARPNGNRVIYSDDFGRTWHALGGASALPAPGGDEPKCEEMPDGRVILSSRVGGGRIYNIYTYSKTETAEGSWGTSVTSTFEGSGKTPGGNSTNGEILIVPVQRNSDSKEMYLALQSLPTGGGRSNVGIFYKELTDVTDINTVANFATDWNGFFEVTTKASAYSSMDLQADNRIGFIYEETLTFFKEVSNPVSTCFPNGEGVHNYDGFDNIYVAYPLELITRGAYSIKRDVSRRAYVSDYFTALAAEANDEVRNDVESFLSIMSDEPTITEVDRINRVLTSEESDGDWNYIRYKEQGRDSPTLSNGSWGYLGDNLQFSATQLKSDTQLWKKVPVGDGTFHIVSKTGKYLVPTAATATDATPPIDSNTTQPTQSWTIKASDTDGLDVIYNPTIPCQIHANKDTRLINWGYNTNGDGPRKNDAGCNFEFVSVAPLTISAAGYATLYLDYDVVIPAGVEVYYASSIDGDRLMMAKITDVIPANTGVIVKASAGTYYFIKSANTPAPIENNLFMGTTRDKYIGGQKGTRYYVLSRVDGVVGMYRAKLTDGFFLNNANKAYLPRYVAGLGFNDDDVDTEDQLSNRFRFDFGGTTSIQNPEFRIQNSQIVYDLQGRRVENPTKGIYIVGGRKVVIK